MCSRSAAQFCLLRDFRQELFRQSRPADGLAVKVRSVEQTEAGGHGGREARRASAGQPHGEIVRDRADGSGPVRDGSGCLMAGECDEAVAGGEGIAGPRSQAGRRAFPVRPRLRARLVLPGCRAARAAAPPRPHRRCRASGRSGRRSRCPEIPAAARPAGTGLRARCRGHPACAPTAARRRQHRPVRCACTGALPSASSTAAEIVVVPRSRPR